MESRELEKVDLNLDEVAEEMVLQVQAFIQTRKMSHIGDIFKQGDRLFFNAGGSEQLDNLLLQNSKLMGAFEDRIINRVIEFTKSNIESIQNAIINDFFSFIKKTKIWEAFWEEQRKIIPPQDIDEILNSVAGAMAYKLIMFWAKQYPDKARDHHYKIIGLTNIFKKSNSAKEAIEEQQTKVSSEIKNQLDRLINSRIPNGKITKNETIDDGTIKGKIYLHALDKVKEAIDAMPPKIKGKISPTSMRILARIAAIRGGELFVSLPHTNETLLAKNLKAIIIELKKRKKDDIITSAKFKEFVECILLDMIINCSKNLDKDSTIPNALLKAQSELAKHIEKQMKAPLDLAGINIKSEYKQFFKLFEKKEKKEVPRTFSLPVFRNSHFFESTARNDQGEKVDGTYLTKSKSELFQFIPIKRSFSSSDNSSLIRGKSLTDTSSEVKKNDKKFR